MEKREFVECLNSGTSNRFEMIEALAAVILSAWPEIPQDLEEQDAEFVSLTDKLSTYSDEKLIQKAEETNLIGC